MPMPTVPTLLIALAMPASVSGGHATQPDAPAIESPPQAAAPTRVEPSSQPPSAAAPPDSVADDPNPTHLLHPVDRRWSLRVEPSYWYAAPRGDIVLPGSLAPVTFPSGSGGLTFDAGDETDLNTLDADNPTGGFQGRAHFARDRWRYSFGAALLSTSGDATADAPGRVGDAFFAPGDSIDTDFDLSAFDATVAYTVFHGPHADDPNGDPSRFRFTFEVIGGARLEALDIDVSITPGPGERPPELGFGADASEIFAQPIGGARLSMDLFDDLGIEVGATVGYFSMSGHTSSTWDVLAAFTWRPVDNVGIEAGYRYLGLSATADDNGSDFEYRGSAAGLFAGLIIQF